MKELPKGYRCQCGHFNEFVAYVYAHWTDELIHTCKGCENKNTVLEGEVVDFQFTDFDGEGDVT